MRQGRVVKGESVGSPPCTLNVAGTCTVTTVLRFTCTKVRTQNTGIERPLHRPPSISPKWPVFGRDCIWNLSRELPAFDQDVLLVGCQWLCPSPFSACGPCLRSKAVLRPSSQLWPSSAWSLQALYQMHLMGYLVETVHVDVRWILSMMANISSTGRQGSKEEQTFSLCSMYCFIVSRRSKVCFEAPTRLDHDQRLLHHHHHLSI